MLNRQVYVSDNEFIICPIADEDRDNYVELHRQINGEHTLFLNEHCKDMMWKQVLEGEDKVFSVFEIYNGPSGVADMVLSLTSNLYTLVLALIYIALGALLFVKRKSETAGKAANGKVLPCLLYTSPSPRDCS